MITLLAILLQILEILQVHTQIHHIIHHIHTHIQQEHVQGRLVYGLVQVGDQVLVKLMFM